MHDSSFSAAGVLAGRCQVCGVDSFIRATGNMSNGYSVVDRKSAAYIDRGAGWCAAR
jgi:hypothetical protein